MVKLDEYGEDLTNAELTRYGMSVAITKAFYPITRIIKSTSANEALKAARDLDDLLKEEPVYKFGKALGYYQAISGYVLAGFTVGFVSYILIDSFDSSNFKFLG